MKISGKAALVTGGASGLGEATVRTLVQEGAQVAFIDLNAQLGIALEKELGENVIYAQTDITNELAVQAVIDKTVEKFGHLDIVANIAGISIPKLIVGKNGPYPIDAYVKVLEVDLIATFNVMTLAVNVMAKNKPNEDGERGVVINTSSIASFHGQPGQAAYSCAKGGVNSLSLPAARELAKWGIRVMAVAPGMFDTPIYSTLAPDVKESLMKDVVFPRRFGKPTEFASIVKHIIENPMLNGDTIRLDGAVRF